MRSTLGTSRGGARDGLRAGLFTSVLLVKMNTENFCNLKILIKINRGKVWKEGGFRWGKVVSGLGAEHNVWGRRSLGRKTGREAPSHRTVALLSASLRAHLRR